MEVDSCVQAPVARTAHRLFSGLIQDDIIQDAAWNVQACSHNQMKGFHRHVHAELLQFF
jgi:hypothetical protein